MNRPPYIDWKLRPPEEKRTHVVVAGSRTFTDYGLLRRKLDTYTGELRFPIILVGGAKGADSLAMRWAVWNWHTVKVFHADWQEHGKAAGPIRNVEMAKAGDVLIAFWNGKSPGTAHMIETARKHKLRVKVVRVK